MKATIIGKLEVVHGGDRGTDYVDANGIHHAQFFNLRISGVAGSTKVVNGAEVKAITADEALELKNGEFYSFSWGLPADEATDWGNYPVGSVFKVEVEVKTKAIGDARVPDRHEGKSGNSVYFNCMRDATIEPLVIGPRPRMVVTRYVADVPQDNAGGAVQVAGN